MALRLPELSLSLTRRLWDQVGDKPGDDLLGGLQLLAGEVQKHVIRDVHLVFPSMDMDKRGQLVLTNYQLCFVYPTLSGELSCRYTSIPNTTVSSVTIIVDTISSGLSSWMTAATPSVAIHSSLKPTAELGLELKTKDIRRLKLFFRTLDDRDKTHQFINEYCFFGYDQTAKMFALRPDAKPDHSLPLLSDISMNTEALKWIYFPKEEFSRMNTEGKFVLSDVNSSYKLCATYPEQLILPLGVKQEVVDGSSQFRSSNRLPVVSWVSPAGACLARCAQPQTGFLARNTFDEELVQAIFNTNTCKRSDGSRPSMHIIDCRNQLAANANRIKGAGVENAKLYNCTITYMNIQNIHAMRTSFKQLGDLCSKDGELPDRTAFENTKWLEHVQLLLKSSTMMADRIWKRGSSLLLHCSDGWDRTAQLSSLVQILLDPYFRTITGFCVLIQKEWLSFGHKFAHRVGHGLAENQSVEISPIFVQFVDAVYQVLTQFPNWFEFTEHFLISLLDNMYNCRFGTFLFNSEYERRQNDVEQKTSSVWLYYYQAVQQSRLGHVESLFINPNYCETKESLCPVVSTSKLQIWDLYYQRYNQSFAQAHDHRRQGQLQMNKTLTAQAQMEQLEHTIQQIDNQNRMMKNVLQIALQKDPQIAQQLLSTLQNISTLPNADGTNYEVKFFVKGGKVVDCAIEKEDVKQVPHLERFIIEDYFKDPLPRPMRTSQSASAAASLGSSAGPVLALPIPYIVRQLDDDPRSSGDSIGEKELEADAADESAFQQLEDSVVMSEDPDQRTFFTVGLPMLREWGDWLWAGLKRTAGR